MELTHDVLKGGLCSIGQHPLTLQSTYLELNLPEKGLSSVEVLRNFPNLMYVNLNDNEVTDIGALEAIPALTQLTVRNNKLEGRCLDYETSRCDESNPSSSGHTASGSMMVSVDASGNALCSLEGLDARHPFLEFLLLGRNRIPSIQSLRGLRFLKVLDLSNNDLEGGLDGIEECASLQELNVSGNRITSLDQLPKLGRLAVLNVAANRIISLAPLADCPMLQNVNARDNMIEFTRQAELLVGLKWLQTLALEGNPLSFKPFYRQRVIFRLQSLGTLDKTSVGAEEKIRACNLYAAEVGGDLQTRENIFRQYFPEEPFVLRTPAFTDDEIDLQPDEVRRGMTDEALEARQAELGRFMRQEAHGLATSMIETMTSPVKQH